MPNTFERLALQITEQAEELILFALAQISAIQERIIRGLSVSELTELRRLEREYERFIAEAQRWMDQELAETYLRGIKKAGAGQVVAGFASTGLLIPDLPSQPISDVAQRILKDYPKHWTMYGVFKQAADDALTATRLPIIRQQRDRIRQIVIQASDPAYSAADTFTRRQLSQALMTQFADEGVTGVIYRNGRRVNLDSYSEMVARSQTKNAFNQANWNRLQELGEDLIVVSVHFPCSDLCEPYQGEVFSISGLSNQYPSLDSAVQGGLFHANCKHSSSGWSEGDGKPEKDIDTAENREMYKAQNRQRAIERNIKKYKRREVTAVDPDDERRANALVKKWQAEQRDHIRENPFLRRNYSREQI